MPYRVGSTIKSVGVAGIRPFSDAFWVDWPAGKRSYTLHFNSRFQGRALVLVAAAVWQVLECLAKIGL